MANNNSNNNNYNNALLKIIFRKLYKDTGKQPKEILLILQDFERSCDIKLPCKLSWDYIHYNLGEILNAKVTFNRRRIVVYYPWIVEIIKNYNNNNILIELRDNFKLTLGHEIAHVRGDFPRVFVFGNKLKFISWVIEVHNDFYGCKILNYNINSLITSYNFKRNYKIKKNVKDIDTLSHPSWERKIKYAEMGVFDIILIKQIALDSGLIRSLDEKHKLIDEIYSFYGEIHLQ